MLASFVDELTNQRPGRQALVKVAISASEVRRLYTGLGAAGASAGALSNLFAKAKYKTVGGDTRAAYEAIGTTPLQAAKKTGIGGLGIAAILHAAAKDASKGR